MYSRVPMSGSRGSDGGGARARAALPRNRFLASIALALPLGAVACAGRAAPPRQPAAPPLVRTETASPAAKFEGDFETRLRDASPDASVGALLDLSEQVDLPRLGIRLLEAGRDRRSRRLAVIGALERTAERQQAFLAPALDEMVAAGALESWTGVAVVNRIVLRGSPRAILELAERPEVARVLPDWSSDGRASLAQGSPPAASLGERFESWGVRATGAPTLWGEGLDGTGIVVASIDTGVSERHEQLAGRRLEGTRGWFDPVFGSPRAADSHGHGTAVLSVAVGGNPSGRIVGMAPGARWASALGLHRNFYSRSRMTLAADWALRVARPDVLLNAWSHDEGACSAFDLAFINAWKAAGIFVVFPAGNAGPGAASGETPASLGGTYPDGAPVFSVAGLLSNDDVLEASSRGPSRCGAARFPSLAAPGAELPYALAGGSQDYAIGSGTSFAAAIAAGAAALLLQADPSLEPDQLERLLLPGCRDLPPPGPDDRSGRGALDLVGTLARLRERLRAPHAAPARRTGSVRQDH